MLNSDDQKSLQIKQENGFFSRIMSKEISPANSSCRVYYGRASGAVPFVWESTPGTPKHPSLESASALRPLTPPPSYYSNYDFRPNKSLKNSKSGQILSSILSRFHQKRGSYVTPSFSWSSSSSSSSLSYGVSPLVPMGPRWGFHRRSYSDGSCRSPVCWRIDDENNKEEKKRLGSSPTSTLCFVVRHRSLRLKRALLSIVGGHSSSGEGINA